MSLKILTFEDCIEKFKTPPKLQKNRYLDKGKYPIVAQEESLVNGYTNDESIVTKIDSPIIIFGDHTRRLKYINFNFVLGADGAKIIKPKSDINVKYFFYYLTLMMPKSIGYARHYKLLKKIKFNIPSLSEQILIVSKLDMAFDEIDKEVNLISKKITELEDLKISALKSVFKNNWKLVKIGDVLKTSAGGTPLKARKEYYEGGKINWLQSGAICKKEITSSKTFITQKGLENSSATIFPKNTLLVAMYGATAAQAGILRFESSTNQAVCGIYPSKKYLPEFLFYFITHMKKELLAKASGVAQPNLSQIKIKSIKIPDININEQKKIIEKIDTVIEKITLLKQNIKIQLEKFKILKFAILKKELQ